MVIKVESGWMKRRATIDQRPHPLRGVRTERETDRCPLDRLRIDRQPREKIGHLGK